MRTHTIGRVGQLRLALETMTWPDEVWASVPEEVQADVLRRLARLLARVLEERRAQP